MPEAAIEYRSGAKPVDKSAVRRIQYARQLCLYGNGDGRPIMDPATLAELAGVHVSTVRRHVDKWIEERETLLRKASGNELGLNLSAATLDAHEKDMMALRSSMDKLRWELSQHDGIISKLQDICSNFSLNTENGDAALEMFEAYLRASGNRLVLEKHFLTLQRQWASYAGVEGMMDVGLTKAKEDAKLQAKLDARTAAAQEGVRDVTPEGLSVFKRS